MCGNRLRCLFRNPENAGEKSGVYKARAKFQTVYLTNVLKPLTKNLHRGYFGRIFTSSNRNIHLKISKMKTTTSEKISIDKDFIETFKQAIHNTEIRSHISNNSISIDENGEVSISDTQSAFLLTLGMEYQKIINDDDSRTLAEFMNSDF